MSPDTSHLLALWGASGTGKTSTLAGWVLGCPGTTWHRGDRETQDSQRRLGDIWTQLQRNQLPPGTPGPSLFTLRHTAGLALRMRDMRGGTAERALSVGTDDHDALACADAALFFVEWPRAHTEGGQHALRHGLTELRPDRPRALVITKCELGLDRGQYQRFANDPHGFASHLPPSLASAVARFQPDEIYPVTTYGWSPGGQPNHTWDELGRLVPWNIAPEGLAAPFEYVLASL